METDSVNNTHTTSIAEVPLIQVPTTAEELLPPNQRSAIDEAASALRAHYSQLAHLYLSAAGLTATVNGSPRWDEAEIVFTVKSFAEKNGYHILAALNTAELAWVLMWGYRRITGHSLRAIQRQGHRLLIEQRRALTHQQAAE